MKKLLLAAALLLTGCSTFNDLGVGGAPALLCDRKGQAVIDDRLVGPDAARLAIVRRFKDGDALCKSPSPG